MESTAEDKVNKVVLPKKVQENSHRDLSKIFRDSSTRESRFASVTIFAPF